MATVGQALTAPLNVKTDLRSMRIGDAIPCRYTASSGVVGVFSELGTCDKELIHPQGELNPDGKFYFIHTGYDHLGRMKLVADRNIQHSISWDTLNSEGIASGSGLPLNEKPFVFTGTNNIDYGTKEEYLITGDFTFSAKVNIKGFENGYSTIISVTASGETLNTNALILIMVSSNGQIEVKHEYGAGSNHFFTTNGSYIIPNKVHKISVIRKSLTKNYEIYVDGDLKEIISYTHNAQKASSGNKQKLVYGEDIGNPNRWRMTGDLYYASLWNRVLSDEERRNAEENNISINSDGLVNYFNTYLVDNNNKKKFDFTIRLLTGGVTASDKDNEWDKIIAESSIDKSLWNLDQPSWVSTTLSGTLANRVLRGQDGYFTSLTSGTANTSTGFRPVLLVEFLNEPPVFDLNTDSEEFHKNSITIFGNITDKDNDQISYQIMLNNEVIEDWSNFINTPVEINYTISNELLILGNNKIVVNIIDTEGNTTRWEKTIPFVNNLPTIDLSVDKLSTFETDVNIVGQIIDPDNDGVSYRLKVNDQVLVDWTAFYTSPHSINLVVQPSYMQIGLNTIVIEYKDEYSDVLSWVGQVILKDIDSFYVDDECHNFSDSIKVGNGSIAYLKVANANANYGYIRTANLILNIINGNFSSGVINVAPILTNWSSDSVTIESLPTIDVDNAIEVEINNATGTHEITASQLLNKMIGRNVFGIAIYSDSFSLELDILGNTVEVDYQPTELILPENVYGNRVRIEWKPIIIKKIAAFEKIRIVRSTTPLFTTYEVIYETTDIHELVCEDRTVSEGTYYYRAEVFNINNPINGTIDYSETTESEFIQEDEFNGTDFVSSHVQIHSVPALQNRLLDFNTPDGYIYDSSKVEVVSGKLQLKDLSI